jgi:hypothetical protein
MSEKRRKPGLAFWVTVVVVTALVGYPVSFGPWCWGQRPRLYLRPPAFYRPLSWAIDRGGPHAWDAFTWYCGLLAADETAGVTLPLGGSDRLLHWGTKQSRDDREQIRRRTKELRKQSGAAVPREARQTGDGPGGRRI